MTIGPAPICYFCTHLTAGKGPEDPRFTCAAFPQGIPQAILSSDVDHRSPYEGDSSVVFEPVDVEARDYADELFGLRGAFEKTPKADEEWARFASDLAACLSVLEEDEYLILSYKRANLFVQFAGQGNFGMRAEAVSNVYITPRRAMLSAEQYQKMVGLGWEPPTEFPPSETGLPPDIDGSPNFFLDLANPVDFDRAAQLAVATFRGIYRIRHPEMLQYKAFCSVDNSPIRFPTLRLKMEPRTAP